MHFSQAVYIPIDKKPASLFTEKQALCLCIGLFQILILMLFLILRIIVACAACGAFQQLASRVVYVEDGIDSVLIAAVYGPILVYTGILISGISPSFDGGIESALIPLELTFYFNSVVFHGETGGRTCGNTSCGINIKIYYVVLNVGVARRHRGNFGFCGKAREDRHHQQNNYQYDSQNTSHEFTSL